MKNKDKIIAAFLVSLGLFSTAQATQYVSSLSVQDKQVLSSAAQDGADAIDTDPRQVLSADNK